MLVGWKSMDMEKCVPTVNLILLYKETFLMKCMKTSLYHQTTPSVLNYVLLYLFHIYWEIQLTSYERVIMSYLTKICFIDCMKNVD